MRLSPCRTFALATLIALASADGAVAQPVANAERTLLSLRASALAELPDSFWSGLTFVRAEEDRQRSLRADITFGMTGDETDSRSLFRVNTGIALARGAFPSEITVVNRLSLLLRDGDVQEDVTNLQISYDYQANNHVEFFAFAERFADNFLSIQQRYEVGFGARTGLYLGRTGPWQATAANFDAVESQLDDVARALATRPSDARLAQPNLSPDDDRRLATSLRYLRQSFRERQSRIFLGLATGMFAEVERAELDLLSTPVDARPDVTPTRIKVSLPGTHRYRLSVRPTIRLRPTRDVQISVLSYYKLPLEGPRWVTPPDGRRRLDYRRDLFTEMVWSIRQDQTGMENVDLVATLNHYYDNVPPQLAASLVADSAAAGRTFNRTIADESHRFVTISLRLRW